MSKQTERQPAPQKNRKKGGSKLPALCSLVGTIAILLVIALLLPVFAARMLGYEVYDVVSGSMEPAIPQGSLVLVQRTLWQEIRPGDVIAFESGGSVVTHRVIEIRQQEGEFVTKGDANEQEDIRPTSFFDLIGRVEHCIPVLGTVFAAFVGTQGKMRLFALLLGGILFRMIGDRLKRR